MIRPPLSPSSQAGRTRFRIVVASQGTPNEIVKVDCILTVSAFTQFSAELDPPVVAAGQPVRVRVKNEGNTQQVVRLTCVSQNDQLSFEYLQPEGAVQPETAEASTLPQDPGDTGSGPDTALHSSGGNSGIYFYSPASPAAIDRRGSFLSIPGFGEIEAEGSTELGGPGDRPGADPDMGTGHRAGPGFLPLFIFWLPLVPTLTANQPRHPNCGRNNNAGRC